MREYIFNSWNAVMDDKRNPLSNIPDLQTRHVVMQILAWMWCIIFSMSIGSITIFAVSAVAHILFIAGIVLTVGTFELAKRNPSAFNFASGYHSYGRGRTYTLWRDKNGNVTKVPMDPNDPGGEHE